jgi:hypothetical protein
VGNVEKKNARDRPENAAMDDQRLIVLEFEGEGDTREQRAVGN